MGKLILIFASAAAGFVAAVAATPEDELRRAHDRGFEEGRKSVQAEAVRRGYAIFDSQAAPEGEGVFVWQSQLSRGRMFRDDRDDRDDSDRTWTGKPGHRRERPRPAADRDEQEAG